MAEPSRIEYAVGRTIHNQRVRLVWSVNIYGKPEWTIHRDELNQRDEPERVGGLTDETILAMADAVLRALDEAGCVVVRKEDATAPAAASPLPPTP